MNINSNQWNQIRYSIYAPIYDSIAYVFSPYRRAAVQDLDIQAGDHLLILGAGTGLDLPYLPENVHITAIDITPAMVKRCQIKANKLGLDADCILMDGHELQFKKDRFDKILLHLILAVIPHPDRCLQEVERVLKPGGKISVIDKFVDKPDKLSVPRKLLNPIARFLFSDINRSLIALLKKRKLIINRTGKPFLFGVFKRYILEKE